LLPDAPSYVPASSPTVDINVLNELGSVSVHKVVTHMMQSYVMYGFPELHIYSEVKASIPPTHLSGTVSVSEFIQYVTDNNINSTSQQYRDLLLDVCDPSISIDDALDRIKRQQVDKPPTFKAQGVAVRALPLIGPAKKDACTFMKVYHTRFPHEVYRLYTLQAPVEPDSEASKRIFETTLSTMTDTLRTAYTSDVNVEIRCKTHGESFTGYPPDVIAAYKIPFKDCTRFTDFTPDRVCVMKGMSNNFYINYPVNPIRQDGSLLFPDTPNGFLESARQLTTPDIPITFLQQLKHVPSPVIAGPLLIHLLF